MHFCRIYSQSLLLVLFLFLFLPFLHAQDITDTTQNPVEQQIRSLLPELASRSTGTPAFEKLVAMRDPKVVNVFKHIEANRLYLYKGQIVVVYPSDDGQKSIYDLFVELDENDQPLGNPIETVPRDTISEQNVLSVARPIQRDISNSLRVLALKLTDPRLRIAAARELGNKRQINALEELRRISQQDPDARVRREAQASVAMIVLSGQIPSISEEERIQAAEQLGTLSVVRSLPVLQERAAAKDLAPQEASAIHQAESKIRRHLFITDWIKNLFYGLSAGSIFVLLALGLAITFGLMGVINMAHGEMLMIGAITTWACFEFISPLLPPSYFDWYYVIAFPLSFLVAALAGLLIEVTVIRHLYKRPLDSLLATIGISYILIQAVRLWKGDNLGMRGPSWAGGSWEIYPDISLAHNRLFLIGLSVFCIVLVIALFRFTRIGLMIRATVQNREMAQALGVNTRFVDMFTFSFGAGLAGLAGYGIVLTSNPTPEMGQAYIVKTFLTVVVGGVGKLAGVICAGMGLGFIEKILEPLTLIEKPIRLFDATWAQVATLVLVVLFIQRRPGGLFPDKGRMADQADSTSSTYGQTSLKTDFVLGTILILIGLGLVPILYSQELLSLEFVNKLGYVVAFAICAIGLDLIWGYIGVLSLCQFLFFALGGYCMGLYLINYGPKAPDGIPQALSVVMSDVGSRSAPWFLSFFESFPLSLLLGLVLPGGLALIIGLTTFRSRVRGVYFSILTQAITVAVWLVFQKNELKLGGTNGLTNFTNILGFQIAGNPELGPFQQTRFWLYVVSVILLLVAVGLTKLLVQSGFGRVLLAIRDDETRLRFVGYQTWAYKTAAFTLAAILGALGGMLYAPQKGIITPRDMAAGASILVVAWVAVGGRGTIWGGCDRGDLCQSTLRFHHQLETGILAFCLRRSVYSSATILSRRDHGHSPNAPDEIPRCKPSDEKDRIVWFCNKHGRPLI
ncbi:MAG: hypothetical protein KatS3mg104_0884 [Phycisphaerae bacterium]|nr:MAG: hypothetical protein KatS3mg104_0884 [Phycisphaerae bacterium]